LLLEEGHSSSARGCEEDGGGTFATCRFVQPLAPRLAVTALGGVEQHAWFDLPSLPVTNGLVAPAAGAMAMVSAAVADDDDARADAGTSVASTASAASNQACAAQLQEAVALVHATLGALRRDGEAAERIVLGGFSQVRTPPKAHNLPFVSFYVFYFSLPPPPPPPPPPLPSCKCAANFISWWSGARARLDETRRSEGSL
jgi:hypothetical protein